MDIKLLNQTRKFWRTRNIDYAKFSRILVSPETRKKLLIGDKKGLNKLWEKQTKKDFQKIFKDIDCLSINSVLEIGCGVGRILKVLEEHKLFSRIIGVDISPKMIQYAEEYLKLQDSSTIELYLTDGENLPIKDNSIDFVFSIVTFQHMTTKSIVKANLKEIYRVLVPKGLARIQTIEHKNPNIKSENTIAGYNGYFLNVRDKKEMFQEYGLKVINWRYDKEVKPANPELQWIWLTLEK